MTKKINNALSVDLEGLFRSQTGQTPPKSKTEVSLQPTKSKKSKVPVYRHCSFICDSILWEKAQIIARRENFSVRQVMEHWMRAGIDSYEAKNAKIKVKTRTGRSLEDVL